MTDLKLSLRVLRAYKHLTQDQAAQLVGISPNTWRRYENGLRPVPSDTVKKICKIWKVSPNELDFL